MRKTLIVSGMQVRIFRLAQGVERDAKQAEFREHLELKFDGKIKAPPSVGLHVFGFIAYSAPLSILLRRHFCNKHEVNRQKMRRRFAKSPKFHAQSKALRVQPAGPLAGPLGWRVPRHRCAASALTACQRSGG